MALNVTTIPGTDPISFYLRNYTWADALTSQPSLTLNWITDLSKLAVKGPTGDPKKLLVDASGASAIPTGAVLRADSDGEMEASDITDTGSGITLGTSATIGTGATGVDYSLTFDGGTSDCTLTWDDSEERLDISDHVRINGDYLNSKPPLILANHPTATSSTYCTFNVESGGGLDISSTDSININTDGYYDIKLEAENSRVVLQADTDIVLTSDTENIKLQPADGKEVIIGSGAAGVDYAIKFDGASSDATITLDDSASDLILASSNLTLDAASSIAFSGTYALFLGSTYLDMSDNKISGINDLELKDNATSPGNAATNGIRLWWDDANSALKYTDDSGSVTQIGQAPTLECGSIVTPTPTDITAMASGSWAQVGMTTGAETIEYGSVVASSANSRLELPAVSSGLWHIFGQVVATTSADAELIVKISIGSGTTYTELQTRQYCISGDATQIDIDGFMDTNTATNLHLYIRQFTGSAIDIDLDIAKINAHLVV